MNMPPQQVPLQHVCFSGTITCSGCMPCDACALQVKQAVLPMAMQAAGFNGSYEQAKTFFQGYMYGWIKLHEAMNSDPMIRRQLQIMDVSGLIQLAQQHAQQAHMMQMQQQQRVAAQAWQHEGYPASPHGNPPMFAYGPNGEPLPINGSPPIPSPSLEDEKFEQMAKETPAVLDPNVFNEMMNGGSRKQGTPVESRRATVEAERLTNLVQPMDPEDIAASTTPIKPVVLGNVMQVPKDYEPK